MSVMLNMRDEQPTANKCVITIFQNMSVRSWGNDLSSVAAICKCQSMSHEDETFRTC